MIAGLKYYSDMRENVNFIETMYQYKKAFYLETNIHLSFLKPISCCFSTSILLSTYLSHIRLHRGPLNKYLCSLLFIPYLIYFAVFNYFTFFVVVQFPRKLEYRRVERVKASV